MNIRSFSHPQDVQNNFHGTWKWDLLKNVHTAIFYTTKSYTVKSGNLPLSPQRAIFIQYEVNMHQHGFEMTK